MKIKCQCCGNKIEKNTAYKITKGSKNLYYCSEDEYNQMIQKKNKDKQLDDEIRHRFYDIFGYQIINTALFKEIKEILTITDKETLNAYLEDNSDKIIKQINKDFASEYAKIRYVSAIIKNTIHDYKPTRTETIVKKAEVEIEYQEEIKYKPRTKRKGLSQLPLT